MTIRSFIEKNYLPAMIAALTMIASIPASQQIHDWWGAWQTPIEWKTVKVLTPIVHPGDDLAMIYTARINRTCPADLRGFLIFEDNSSPVRFPVVAGGYRLPSEGFIEFTVHVTIPLMADPGLGRLLPGMYVYRTLVTRYCPEGIVQDNAIPDVKFRLVN